MKNIYLEGNTIMHFETNLLADKQAKFHTRANRDPITGTSGAHPVGTGFGAAGGAAAGAAIGAFTGPVGAAIGLIVGAVAGGLAGKVVAEAIHPTDEEAYWTTTH